MILKSIQSASRIVRTPITVTAFLFVIASCLPLASQNIPTFDFDVFNVMTKEGESKLDVFTRVPFSSLQFTDQQTSFEANYEILAEVFELDEKGRQKAVVLSKIWERSQKTSSFVDTRSDTLADLATQTLTELTPGLYVMEMQLEDRNSGATFLRKQKFEVKSFRGSTEMSGLLFADDFDANTRKLTPNIASALGSDRNEIVLFYEVYSSKNQLVEVSYQIYKKRENTKPSFRTVLGLEDKEMKKFEYEVSESLQLEAGENEATKKLELEKLKVGDYVVRVLVSDGNGAILTRSQKDLSIQWTGLEDQIADIAGSVDQLRYIAKAAEIRAINRASDVQEKGRLFREFWSRRDPTPGTPRNERMEEYYYRIKFANEKYSRFGDGWQTDLGQVYVLYGEPDYTERYPYSFGSSKPYQVWSYYSIGRRFVFIDRTGVGDYELLVPIWDERTRMR